MLTWSIKRNELVRRSSNNETPLTAVLYSMLYSQIRCIALRVLQTSKGFWVFCSVSHLSGGGSNANHNTTRSPMPASPSKTKPTMALDWMKVLSREGDRHCFILASKEDICKKDQKNFPAKLVNYCPKQDDHQQWTLKHRNKQNGSKSTNHKSLTMTFWTRSSTHLFPKRVAQRIWQLYRRKKVKCQVPIVLKHLASTYVPTFP